MKIISKSEKETIDFGRALSGLLSGGEVIALFGELGSGKTQFVKGLALGFGLEGKISSPTFVIKRDYVLDKLNFVHYDFYRLDEIDRETEEGVKEDIENKRSVVAIEWSEKIEKILPKNCIKIFMKHRSENERTLNLEFIGDRAKKIEGKFAYEVIKCQK